MSKPTTESEKAWNELIRHRKPNDPSGNAVWTHVMNNSTSRVYPCARC
jgi:hypothetical protein